MKKYRIPALLLSLVLMLNLLALPAAALEEPELQCTHAILVDANYGEVLYAKKADEKAYPASITKVMTALLVLEAIDSGKLKKDQQITAGPTPLQDMSGNYSTANLEPGDVLTVEQLLYCLLLPSANEAGNILAVAVDGGMRRLDAAEIYYLESEGHKVHFYTEKEDFMVPGTLKNYEEKLVGRAFARCNSGYLVNLAQVSGVQQDMVQVGPYALQISRPRRKAFMAELADYIGGAGQ